LRRSALRFSLVGLCMFLWLNIPSGWPKWPLPCGSSDIPTGEQLDLKDAKSLLDKLNE
jgi:hypothetical protein